MSSAFGKRPQSRRQCHSRPQPVPEAPAQASGRASPALLPGPCRTPWQGLLPRHMDVKRQQHTVCVASTRAGGRAFLGSAGGTGFRSTRCLPCPSVGPVDGVCPPTHCQRSPLPRRAQAMMRASVCPMPQSLLRLHHPRTSATQRRGEERRAAPGVSPVEPCARLTLYLREGSPSPVLYPFPGVLSGG